MKKEQIENYRNSLSDHQKETENDFESNISNITLAIIAFFLTIQEKYFKFEESNFVWVFILSFILLISSFIIGLLAKKTVIKNNSTMIDYIDNQDLSQNDTSNELLEIWKSNDKKVKRIKNIVIYFLIFGFILQLFWFLNNLIYPNNNNVKSSLIENIKPKKDTVKELKTLKLK